jgi:anti-sigma factor RsiW
MDKIGDDELHAYVDGALPEARRLEVEAWLAAHPEDARRTQDWLDLNRALHTAYDGVLNEPVPIELIRSAKRKNHRTLQRVAAALAFVATGLIGYGIGQHTATSAQPMAELAHDAAIAHVVFTPEVRHPVEVGANDSAHLVAWLSKRLGTTLRAPDFHSLGFELMGGRLLSNETGPVAQFMYQDARQRRVTLYVRRDASGNRETAFHQAKEDGVEVFYWVDQNFGYALSGQISHPEIKQLAMLAYRQMVSN